MTQDQSYAEEVSVGPRFEELDRRGPWIGLATILLLIAVAVLYALTG